MTHFPPIYSQFYFMTLTSPFWQNEIGQWKKNHLTDLFIRIITYLKSFVCHFLSLWTCVGYCLLYQMKIKCLEKPFRGDFWVSLIKCEVFVLDRIIFFFCHFNKNSFNKFRMCQYIHRLMIPMIRPSDLCVWCVWYLGFLVWYVRSFQFLIHHSIKMSANESWSSRNFR